MSINNFDELFGELDYIIEFMQSYIEDHEKSHYLKNSTSCIRMARSWLIERRNSNDLKRRVADNVIGNNHYDDDSGNYNNR